MTRTRLVDEFSAEQMFLETAQYNRMGIDLLNYLSLSSFAALNWDDTNGATLPEFLECDSGRFLSHSGCKL
jgi:hypothetical protein